MAVIDPYHEVEDWLSEKEVMMEEEEMFPYGDVLNADFIDTYNEKSMEIYEANKENGFWEEGENRNVGEMIALIHSELSEALEAYRKNLDDDHLVNYDGLTVELADTIIRIMDMGAGLGLPVAEALIDKVEYNKSRGYKHGKNF